MVALSQCEAVLIRVLCSAWGTGLALRVGAALLLLCAAYWLYARVWWVDGGDAPWRPTLCDPGKLDETLRFFTQNGPGAAAGADRHRGEALCRRMLETMLRMKLPKVRPKWLVNPTTKRCLFSRVAVAPPPPLRPGREG
jgi:hypothetical protein